MSFRESDFSGQSISPALAEAEDMLALEIARPGFAMQLRPGVPVRDAAGLREGSGGGF